MIFIGSILAVIAVIVFIVRAEASRAKDVQLVAEARALAVALERYYSDYRSFPAFDKNFLTTVSYISDQGINKKGEKTYYDSNFKWPMDSTLAVQNDDYQLDFTVKNSWPAWGINKLGGGRCRIMKNTVLLCVDL